MLNDAAEKDISNSSSTMPVHMKSKNRNSARKLSSKRITSTAKSCANLWFKRTIAQRQVGCR